MKNLDSGLGKESGRLLSDDLHQGGGGGGKRQRRRKSRGSCEGMISNRILALHKKGGTTQRGPEKVSAIREESKNRGN